jgi:hypothetical protein
MNYTSYTCFHLVKQNWDVHVYIYMCVCVCVCVCCGHVKRTCPRSKPSQNYRAPGSNILAVMKSRRDMLSIPRNPVGSLCRENRPLLKLISSTRRPKQGPRQSVASRHSYGLLPWGSAHIFGTVEYASQLVYQNPALHQLTNCDHLAHRSPAPYSLLH